VWTPKNVQAWQATGTPPQPGRGLDAAARRGVSRLRRLRHCAATYLRAAGADLKTVQETLGHADLNITADTYTSVLVELERATAEAAAGLIPRNHHNPTGTGSGTGSQPDETTAVENPNRRPATRTSRPSARGRSLQPAVVARTVLDNPEPGHHRPQNCRSSAHRASANRTHRDQPARDGRQPDPARRDVHWSALRL
jgi:hypothetical protein